MRENSLRSSISLPLLQSVLIKINKFEVDKRMRQLISINNMWPWGEKTRTGSYHEMTRNASSDRHPKISLHSPIWARGHWWATCGNLSRIFQGIFPEINNAKIVFLSKCKRVCIEYDVAPCYRSNISRKNIIDEHIFALIMLKLAVLF